MSDRADDRLEARLLAAHERSDPAELAVLYGDAAERAGRKGDVTCEAFFLTHALVHALEAGARAELYAARLRDMGRLD